MAKSGWMTEDARETELFKMLKESFDERADAVPEKLKFLHAGRDNVDCEQIGMEDGFINYIYRIKEKSSGKSAVVKWTRAVSRVAEKEEIEFKEELTDKLADNAVLQRNTKESEALERIGKDLVPGSTPKVFWVDPKRYFFIMEDLAGYKTLRQMLIDGEVILEVFTSISRMLATLHKATHVKTLGEVKFEKFSSTLYENPLIETIAAIWFDQGFKKDSEFAVTKGTRVFGEYVEKVLPELYDNDDVSAVLQQMKESFLSVHVCYLHNDTHPGSFLINEEHDIRMLDLEASTLGNPAKEVGYTLGEIVAFYYVYQGRKEPELAQKLKHSVKLFVLDYMQRMSDLIDDKAKFMQYLSGHAGHFGCFRVANEFLPFPPLQGMDQAEAKCISVLAGLMKDMNKITSLEKFLSAAFK